MLGRTRGAVEERPVDGDHEAAKLCCRRERVRTRGLDFMVVDCDGVATKLGGQDDIGLLTSTCRFGGPGRRGGPGGGGGGGGGGAGPRGGRGGGGGGRGGGAAL